MASPVTSAALTSSKAFLNVKTVLLMALLLEVMVSSSVRAVMLKAGVASAVIWNQSSAALLTSF